MSPEPHVDIPRPGAVGAYHAPTAALAGDAWWRRGVARRDGLLVQQGARV